MEKIINKIACCLLVFMFLMRFFYVQDPYFICTFLLVICLTVCLTRQMIKLTIIDLCLLLLWAYIGMGPTVNFAGSAYSFITLTSNILYYFLLRYIITYDKKGEQSLLSSFTVCIAVLSALAFILFIFSVCQCMKWVLVLFMISDFYINHWEYPIMNGVAFNGCLAGL